MNDTGKNIVGGFRKLRKFCREVSLLLKTTEDMMKDKGWERAKLKKLGKPSAVLYTYNTIDWPDWWLPYEFFRFFKHSEVRCLSPYIAVNLDYPNEAYPVEYVLLSAGCIVFQSGTQHDNLAHPMTRWHLMMNDRKDDGSLFLDEPQKTWKPENGDEEPPAGVLRVTTFAYPLVDVADCAALKQKVVLPLLKLIEEEAKRSNAK